MLRRYGQYDFQRKLIHFERFSQEWTKPGLVISEDTITFPLDVQGIKELRVEVVSHIFNGKGFIKDAKYLSTATIGDSRKMQIELALESLFQRYLLDNSQPEGFYEEDGGFLPRISSVTLAPLFACKSKYSDMVRFYEYDEGIVSTGYGDYAYIDENDDKYTYLREITPFEREHNCLYVWKANNDEDYMAIPSIPKHIQNQIADLRVFDSRVMNKPPLFPIGSVIEDAHRKRVAKVVKHHPATDDETELFDIICEDNQHEDHHVAMSSHWMLAEDQQFETEVDSLVFCTSDTSFYRAVLRRQNYALVQSLDKSPFMPSFHVTELYKVIRKEDLAWMEYDINQSIENGRKRCDADASAEILFRLMDELNIIHDETSRYLVIGISGKTRPEFSDITLKMLKLHDEYRYRSEKPWVKEFLLSTIGE